LRIVFTIVSQQKQKEQNMTDKRNFVAITIVKDDSESFLKTLQSVSMQTVRPKHLVIDGSSDKQNQELIRQAAESRGSHYLYQRAAGIYAAMNFALINCHDDDMVVFLNSGDCFFNETTAQLIHTDLYEDSEAIFLYDCVFGSADGFIPSIQGANAQTVARGEALVCHQGVVASVKLMKSVGMFDQSYSISADHKLLLGMLKVSRPKIQKTTLAIIALGGVSDLNCSQLAIENSRARNETGLSLEPMIRDVLYTRYRIIRCKTKLLIRRITKFTGLPPNIAQKILHRSKR
jgi:hypothetical protein